MRTLTITALLLSCCAVGLADEPVPYGHPDFFPSTERPVGWRGDGSGNFPGASVPLEYSQESVIWKTPLAAGFCQPIVVGEKVFVTADPNLLVCISAKDGSILWKRAVDHTEAMPPEMQKKAREEIAFFADVWKKYSQWRTDVEEFEKKVKEKGFEFRTLTSNAWQSGSKVLSKYKRWPRKKELDEQRAAEHEKVLADKELGPELKRLIELQDKYHFAIQTGCNADPVLLYDRRNAGPLRERYFKANREYDIYFSDNWEGFTTWSFATPCSDGQYVYVTTVNNAVACYDLNGNQKWLVWEHPDNGGGKLHTRFVASPILYKDKLIVNQNSHLRVYDKRTGKTIWEIISPYEPERDHQKRSRNLPEAASPSATTLSLPDGGSLDVLIDGGSNDHGKPASEPRAGNIYRLSDGKIIGNGLKYTAKGSTPVVKGDLYVWLTSVDAQPGVFGVDKMIAKSRDEVEVTPLWQDKNRLKASSSVLCDDQYVYWANTGRKGAYRHDLQTGEKQYFLKGRVGRQSCSGVLAGKRLVNLKASKFMDKRSGEPDGRIPLYVGDLKTGTVVESNIIRDLRMYEDEDYALRNRWVGCPNQVSNSSPVVQANRIFYRSKGYLWCLGDPSQPFPTPTNCPADARAR